MTTLRDGIVQTAKALGISPLDLATAIGYETAGSFDPNQPGVSTKWGQHRGLIQFGEPQAISSGVDWNNALESQIGNNGENAVYRYLKKAGVQPGMSLLDIYSAINAGSVGQYRAMDQGTSVSQKVYSDVMRKHQEKAAALLGGEWTPTATALGTAEMDATNPNRDDTTSQLLKIVQDQIAKGDQTVKPPEGDQLAGMLTKGVSGLPLNSSASGSQNYGDASTDMLPVPDFAAATPPPGAVPLTTDLSPLAKLFELPTIGQGNIAALQRQQERTF